jgi:hypothetical protein
LRGEIRKGSIKGHHVGGSSLDTADAGRSRRIHKNGSTWAR